MRPGYLRDRIMAGTRRVRHEEPELIGACPVCHSEVRFRDPNFSALKSLYTTLRTVPGKGLYPARLCPGRHTVAELRRAYGGRLVHPELAPDTIL